MRRAAANPCSGKVSRRDRESTASIHQRVCVPSARPPGRGHTGSLALTGSRGPWSVRAEHPPSDTGRGEMTAVTPSLVWKLRAMRDANASPLHPRPVGSKGGDRRRSSALTRPAAGEDLTLHGAPRSDACEVRATADGPRLSVRAKARRLPCDHPQRRPVRLRSRRGWLMTELLPEFGSLPGRRFS